MRFSLSQLFCIATMLSLLLSAMAQEERATSYLEAAAGIDNDLKAELARLAEVRQRIAAERPPLAKETEEIAVELREKRRLADIADQTNQALEFDLRNAERELQTWRAENQFIRSALTDYRKQLEAQLSLSELEQLQSQVPREPSQLGDVQLESLIGALEFAADHLEQAAGGTALPGSAIGPDGIAQTGTLLRFGPTEWFLSDDQQSGGIVVDRPDLQPEFLPGTASPKNLKTLASGETATVTLDPTLGNALAMKESSQSPLDHLKAGGVWIVPILLLAGIATIAALYKWAQILAIRDLKPGMIREVTDHLRAGERDQAAALLQSLRHPARAVLESGVEFADRPHDLVEEVMYERYMEAQPRLQRGLPFIAIASATAPLLGLLGTVTGMIHTFQLINVFGTGDARSLASGISEALVTTEFGLIVAIPALILHAMLSRKIKGILSSMEMASLAFLNSLKSEVKTS